MGELWQMQTVYSRGVTQFKWLPVWLQIAYSRGVMPFDWSGFQLQITYSRGVTSFNWSGLSNTCGFSGIGSQISFSKWSQLDQLSLFLQAHRLFEQGWQLNFWRHWGMFFFLCDFLSKFVNKVFNYHQTPHWDLTAASILGISEQFFTEDKTLFWITTTTKTTKKVNKLHRTKQKNTFFQK